MPSVDCWYDKRLEDFPPERSLLGERDKFLFIAHMKPVIAKAMNCDDDNGEPVVHYVQHIRFRTLRCFADSGIAQLELQVTAHDWLDRMRNMDERLKMIGITAREYFSLPEQTVDIGFVIMPCERPAGGRPERDYPLTGCWVRV